MSILVNEEMCSIIWVVSKQMIDVFLVGGGRVEGGGDG